MFLKEALSAESAAYRVVTPSQAFTRKISRLIAAVAIFTYRVIVHVTTRGEACHWILGRLRLPTARLSATHNNLRVASLLQIMFAAVTPVPLPPLEMTEWG